MTINKPRTVAQASVGDTWQGSINIDRIARAGDADEMVFLRTVGAHEMMLILTPTEAADLGEALQKVSGMASSTYSAQFLAQSVRDGLARLGVTRKRIAAETGITEYRLRQLLNYDRPMTQAELKAISNVGAAERRAG